MSQDSFIQSWFLDHPHSQNMTYLGHLVHAWGFGWKMAKGAIALFIHGVVPKWFQTTGSQTIHGLYYEITPKSPPPSPYSEQTISRIPPLETA